MKYCKRCKKRISVEYYLNKGLCSNCYREAQQEKIAKEARERAELKKRLQEIIEEEERKEAELEKEVRKKAEEEARKEKELQEKAEEEARQKVLKEAYDYFAEEKISCISDEDGKTLRRLYDALVSDNYNTANESNLTDALSTLDANSYYLAQALIYQNFMLMRRIDKLLNEISELKNQLKQSKADQ